MTEVWCDCPQCGWSNSDLWAGENEPTEFYCDDCGCHYNSTFDLVPNEVKTIKAGTLHDEEE